jgi:hypothetical protein
MIQALQSPETAPRTIRTPHARASIERLALSPDEAAASIGCSRTYFDEHITHELRWVRRGRRKFVAVRELERWLTESGERTL